jgi:hypothetical protein
VVPAPSTQAERPPLGARGSLTATVKSIDPAAFMEKAASDYVLALRVLHAGSIIMTHAVEAAHASEDTPQPSPNSMDQGHTHAGLAVGSEAPNFLLDGLHGENLTFDSVRSSDKLVMLLFTDPNCGPCNALLPEIGRWQEKYPRQARHSSS